MTILEAK
jgi:hypothetical protein